MSLRKHSWVVVCLAAAGFCAAAWAATPEKPDVEGLITNGLAAYKAGKSDQAVDYLQKAISAIQKSGQKGLAVFFPTVAGFKAGEPEISSTSMQNEGKQFTAVMASRSYTRESDELQVTVSMNSSPQYAQSWAEMSKGLKAAAAMMKSDEHKIEFIDKAGWSGWMNVEKDSSSQLQLMHGGMILTIDAGASGGETVLKQFLAAMDLPGLAKLAPQKPQ